MHLTCMKWLEHVRDTYPEYFNDCSVLEMGSLNYNGSVRPYFKNCSYIGVDWQKGIYVDIVSLAHEVTFNKQFRTIISCSMLEHDPYWEKSLVRMIDLLEDTGGLFLSWGGVDSVPHGLESAPDGLYHSLKARLVYDYLENKGLCIHEFGGEDSFMKYLGLVDIDLRIAKHCFSLVGFKGKEYAKTKRLIFEPNEANR